MHDARIEPFLEKLTTVDGAAALSDAKLLQMRIAERICVIEEGDRVVALGVAAPHDQLDGSHHWAVETALDTGLRFAAFEDRLLQSALALVPDHDSMSVWSHRRSMDKALTKSGFKVARELVHLSVTLPLANPGSSITTRRLNSGDTSRILDVNRKAFLSHREAASLDEVEFARLIEREGMGRQGFLIAEEEDELLGFCWTRVHENGDGEIFRIAVSPGSQGRGIGRALVVAGFSYLANQPTVSRGTLWVDRSNTTAVDLYEGLGMVEIMVNREFEMPTGDR
jgi:mycothiol synthase